MQAMTEAQARQRVLLGICFGFGAALAYGSSQVLARHTVSELAAPLVGSSLALFWGTLGFFLLTFRGLRGPNANFRLGAFYFGLAGIFSSMGVTGLFLALERAQVVIVSPVVSTNPLFTLVLAAIFLRDVERLTLRVIVGAMLVVGGVVVLSVA
jgi:drug/metabolite transporter (DMT)-like permease